MCDLFKTKPKKGTMRKEKPKKNQTQKQFVLIFCHWNRTTDNTHTHTHSDTLIPKQQKAACENWQQCSASATAHRVAKFGNRAPALGLFFLIWSYKRVTEMWQQRPAALNCAWPRHTRQKQTNNKQTNILTTTATTALAFLNWFSTQNTKKTNRIIPYMNIHIIYYTYKYFMHTYIRSEPIHVS